MRPSWLRSFAKESVRRSHGYLFIALVCPLSFLAFHSSLLDFRISFSYSSPSLAGSYAVYQLWRPKSDYLQLLEALLLPSGLQEGLIKGQLGHYERDVALFTVPEVMSFPRSILWPILLQFLV
jgi:hypothetical protein